MNYAMFWVYDIHIPHVFLIWRMQAHASLIACLLHLDLLFLIIVTFFLIFKGCYNKHGLQF